MHKNLAGLVLLVVLFGNVLIAYAVFGLGRVELYAEGALLENLQASFLALAAAVYLAVAVATERELRVAFLSCFLLCVSFFLREVDVQDYQLPSVLIMLGSGWGRNLMLLLAWSVVLGAVAWNLQGEVRAFRRCIFSPAGYLMMAAGGFVIAGAAFDKELLSLGNHAFYEELAELDGYFLMLQSSLVSLLSLKGIAVCDPQPLKTPTA